MTGVSFIIPFHRGITFLRDSVSCIIDLNLDDFEIIVIYDSANKEIGCKEKRPEQDPLTFLQEHFEGYPIKVITLSEKKGVSAARNEGIKHASKGYVYFLDCDDYIIKEGFLEMLTTAEKNDACIVYSPYCTTWFKRETFIKQQSGETLRIKELISERSQSAFKLYQSCSTIMDSIDALLHIGKEQCSVINILFNREWLYRQQLYFDERQVFYPDIAFVTEAILNIAEDEKIYFSNQIAYGKRYHNDPILNPSLSQLISPQRPEQYLDAYVSARNIITAKIDSTKMRCAQESLQQNLIKYLISCYRGKFNKSSNQVMPQAVFETYSELLREIPSSLFIEYPKGDQKLLEQIKKNHSKGALKLANRQFIKQKKHGLFGSKIQRARVLQKLLFSRMKIKDNWIMFESFGGKSYSDNCKYIYEYMLKTYGSQYRYIWVIKEDNIKLLGEPIQVKPNTYQYVYYMTRAKYKVFNSRQPDWYVNRKGMKFIQTWHGTPLKKLVFDMEDVHSASMSHKKDFYKVSRQWSYLLSDNTFSTEVFTHAFLFEKEKIIETGYPRNDILCLSDQQSKIRKIKESLGIPLDKKVILYAPTWRDDSYYASGQYKFKLELNTDLLKESLEQEYVILLRTHYFVVDQIDSLCKDSFLYNGSRYQDISELYLISDVCITDYSSVFFDYANLKRPIIFYTYDIDKYRDELHGFYIDMESELPGPIVTTSEQVLDAIENINSIQLQYKGRYEKFCERFCNLDDGHASQRVVEWLIRPKS